MPPFANRRALQTVQQMRGMRVVVVANSASILISLVSGYCCLLKQTKTIRSLIFAMHLVESVNTTFTGVVEVPHCMRPLACIVLTWQLTPASYLHIVCPGCLLTEDYNQSVSCYFLGHNAYAQKTARGVLL